MAEFPIKWMLEYNDYVVSKKNRHMSSFSINTEWRIECFWSQNARPELLEICRNSKEGDVLVSGSFEVIRGSACLLKRKFLQLVEAGSTSTLIPLELPRHNYTYMYTITGTLTKPAGMTRKDDAKGVQFESLLELSNDFERLFKPEEPWFSDVNLRCGTVSIPAHKNILSARSPVFAAMFEAQMREKLESKVDVVDLSPDVLKSMLTFMYGGKTGALSVECAGELLFAADKYQIADLKRVCCDFLKSCVSLENVLNTLVLGYLHDKNLQVFAMNFICYNCEEFAALENTNEWENLREENPSLAMDVLIKLVKSKEEKLKGCKCK